MPLHTPTPLRPSPLPIARFLLACLLATLPTGTPRASEGESLHRKLREACVEILLDGRLEASGWIASRSGLVVTAAHALWNRPGQVEILSPSLGRLPATLAALDRGNDLALLRLPPSRSSWPFLRLARSNPAPLDPIHLYGSPIFRHGVLVSGRVARPDPTFEYYADLRCSVRCLHVDALTPKGFSGGPWVDPSGRVVGTQSGMLVLGDAPQGLAFMVPLDAIQTLLRDRQAPTTADSGAIIEEAFEQPVTDPANRPGPGLHLFGVQPDSPAALAGLRKGDRITALDLRPIDTRDAFHATLRKCSPGTTVHMTVVSGSQAPRQVPVRLDDLNRSATTTNAPARP